MLFDTVTCRELPTLLGGRNTAHEFMACNGLMCINVSSPETWTQSVPNNRGLPTMMPASLGYI